MKTASLQEAFKILTPLREQRFISAEHNVQGFIDAIHENGEGIHLVDYKTSKSDALTGEYKLQLAIYALLYKQNKNILPHKVGIHFLGSGQEQFLDVNTELLALAETETKAIQEHTKSNEKKDYPKKPGPLCKFSSGQCDFYDTCKPFD